MKAGCPMSRVSPPSSSGRVIYYRTWDIEGSLARPRGVSSHRAAEPRPAGLSQPARWEVTSPGDSGPETAFVVTA